MDSLLLNRLDLAAERLLEKNRRLSETCLQLKAEKTEWQQERRDLLVKIESVLARLDAHLDQEKP